MALVKPDLPCSPIQLIKNNTFRGVFAAFNASELA
jgi:hypothetical protein